MHDYEPTDLKSQARLTAEEQARQREEARIAAEDLKWVMSNKRGRRYIWRLLAASKVFHQTFDTNAMKMAHNEGRRAMGLTLLNELMALCPENYDLMLKEQR